MTAYYNENDSYAAEWLRNLIICGHIVPGDVDERSILDVRADDFKGYTQCHFFAGIGGWSYALRLAGWTDDQPVWTGSCPCQPFSAAGQQKAQKDERHLWPVWFRLIASVRPGVVFGEQVERAIAHGWLDDAFDDLEREGYETGAAVLPACSVGAPHKRDRLWFVAHPKHERRDVSSIRGSISASNESRRMQQSERLHSTSSSLANPASQQNNAERELDESKREPMGRAWETFSKWQASNHRSIGRGKIMADADSQGFENVERGTTHEESPGKRTAGNSGWWDIEPGMGRVADGIPSRVGKLRALGNAIVPQVAAEFIKAFMDCRP